jgi:pimeloyl-ACP methyl ester carboxylesterase
MPLAHTIVGRQPAAARRHVLVLHGILGSRRNWLFFCRTLAERRPETCFIVVDLRGHGDSHGFAAPHTLASCADDLHALCEHLAVTPELVCGHSFSGKLALQYAARPDTSVSWAVVLDAPLGTDLPDPGSDVGAEVDRLFALLRTTRVPCTRREDVQSALAAQGLGKRVIDWLSTNLHRTAAGYTWRFDLDIAEALLRDYFRHDHFRLLEAPGRPFEVTFVRGEQSDRFPAGATERLRALHEAGRIQYHVLARAGHWLHADNPDGLMAILEPLT